MVSEESDILAEAAIIASNHRLAAYEVLLLCSGAIITHLCLALEDTALTLHSQALKTSSTPSSTPQLCLPHYSPVSPYPMQVSPFITHSHCVPDTLRQSEHSS